MDIGKLIEDQEENKTKLQQQELERLMAEEQRKEMNEFTPKARTLWPAPIRKR
jgi:hypothetical protein